MSASPPRNAVRPAYKTELARTARLHQRHLPSGFFARLGRRFLRRYHQAFVESPEAEVFVAQTPDGPQGLLVGTFDNAAHYRWAMRRRGVLLALAGLVALLRRPRLAAEFVLTRMGRYARALARWLRPRRWRAATAAEPARQVAVLTHVAVAPAARGHGAGRELVTAFVRAARRRGADEVRLITPADGPGAGFYRALGWRRLARRRRRYPRRRIPAPALGSVIFSSFRLAALLCAPALVVGACGAEVSAPADDQPTGESREEQRAPEPDDDPGEPESDGEAGPEPETESEPEQEPVPEMAEPYEPLPGEVRPNAKRLAARVVEGLTNYEAGEQPREIVASVTEGPLADDLVRDASAVFHEGAWSRGEIVYPQLGGMLDDETSVMVVVDQLVGLPDGSVREETRTMDVRLDLHEGEWVVAELASAGGEPVERPEGLPDEARAVLEDERIDLPDTAIWDIHRGEVDEELLVLMARMAERTPYGVVVLDTGHPREIFGTGRQSKHTRGQAVDMHRLAEDGAPVIEDRREGSATYEFVRWIYEQPELSEVGSPWALDGYGGRSFSDPLHQDHLHVGVR